MAEYTASRPDPTAAAEVDAPLPSTLPDPHLPLALQMMERMERRLEQRLEQNQQTMDVMLEQIAAMREELRSLRGEKQHAGNGRAGAASLPPPTALPPPPRTLSRSSTATRDPFFSASLKRQHPMYLVAVKTLLAPSFGHFRPHEELKAAGHLVEYQPWMEGKVLFVSHTWLRYKHPDNAQGVKFALLCAVLQRAAAGALDVSPYWVTEFQQKKAGRSLRLNPADMRRALSNGYVFMDYMSIPQADAEAQKRAVASLVSYVSSSSHFMCLAGPWTHEDGSPRDDFAWSGRGWCRMEGVSNFLSPLAKPIILACSPSRIITLPSCGVLGRDFLIAARVGHGAFSVEEDKQALGRVLQSLITARKALARSDGDMLMYRVLHASSSRLLDGCGVEQHEEKTLDEWMAAMAFETAKDKMRGSHLTPLHFAAMTGRADLVEALLDGGASLTSKCKQDLPMFGITKRMTALGLAGQCTRDGAVVELLLRRGADPRQAVLFDGAIPLALAAAVGNAEGVRAFLRHDATLAEHATITGIPSLCTAFITGQKPLVTLLREEYPEVLQTAVRRHDITHCGMGLCALAISLDCDPDVLGMALDAGEQVDVYAPRVKGIANLMYRVSDLAAKLRPMQKLQNATLLNAYVSRSHALHMAAYTGALRAIDLLLERGSDVHSTANPKGMTPLILAAIGGHDDVCARLLEAGARPSIKDKLGRTALDYAAKFGHEAMRRRLQAASSRL